MPKLRIALNGFGRIGRLFTRYILEETNAELVAVNDLGDPATLVHLFEWDSIHGRYPGTVELHNSAMVVNGKPILLLNTEDPAALPWKKLNIDVVVEATGAFRTGKDAQKHLRAGAKRVVLSAPGKDTTFTTVVIGVNHTSLTSSDLLISNASCTTNCLAPLVKILDDHFGVRQGMMSTIHAYTSDQRLQDAPHRDLRRARAAATNIIPTTTGAAKAIGQVLPHLNGKIAAISYRVPVADGSLIDLIAQLERPTTKEHIQHVFQTAAHTDYQGILQYSTHPLVSSDIIGNTHSAILDAPLLQLSGDTVRLVAWYDNESGYAKRLSELVAHHLPAIG